MEASPQLNDNISKSIEDHEVINAPQQPINSNGFTFQLTPLQLLPILYVLVMSIQITIVICKLTQFKTKIPLIIFYYLFVSVCSGLWYVTTKIDPTDSIQLKHRRVLQENGELNSSQYKFFCHICQTCVSRNAFHCKKCNRCVEMFDHHCIWLNNCIGAKNYFQFFYLICSTELLIVYHISVNTFIVISQNNNGEIVEWFFYPIIALIIMDFIIFCLNTVLLSMHIYLITQKKSTIDLIREMRGYNKIHPSNKQNLDSKQKQQISHQCDSAQQWKIQKKKSNVQQKVEQLIIKAKKQSPSLSQQSSPANREIILIRENPLKKPLGKLTPLKLVKIKSEQK